MELKRRLEKKGDTYRLTIDKEDGSYHLEQRFTKEQLKKDVKELQEMKVKYDSLIKASKEKVEGITAEENEELKKFLELAEKANQLNEKKKAEAELKSYEAGVADINLKLKELRGVLPELFR